MSKRKGETERTNKILNGGDVFLFYGKGSLFKKKGREGWGGGEEEFRHETKDALLASYKGPRSWRRHDVDEEDITKGGEEALWGGRPSLLEKTLERGV